METNTATENIAGEKEGLAASSQAFIDRYAWLSMLRDESSYDENDKLEHLSGIHRAIGP